MKQYTTESGDLVEVHPLTQKKAADASRELARRNLDWRPGSSPMHVEFEGGVELAFQLVASFESNGQKLSPTAYRKRIIDDDDLRAWIVQKASELREETSKKSEVEGKNS